ncbi:MAG: NAD-dependent succinate-semialdehyde dehydrogenase [Planctomycetes bacterium]|nr:NAD-dependent succinate-semialdehyde dehydrogenase [Planctomycetota bacterium]
METHAVYVNGEWIETDETMPVQNPATEEVIARISVAGFELTARAIEAAQEAFPNWKSRTAMERADLLLAMAEEVEQRTEDMARTITRENGKPLAQSRGEVGMTIDHLRWFAEEVRRAYGRVVPHQEAGKRHLVIRTPVGVVGAIAPWNFPLVLSVRKSAPALAAGCPVVLKPSSSTSLCALELARCAEEAGIPAGVFQVLTGDAHTIASEMMSNPLCRKVSFTGSTRVGKELIQQSAETVTNVSMELGGHAPLLVFDDADLEDAVEAALITKFRNTGQSCIASNRIYVQQGVYEDFVEMFVERTQEMPVGDGMEEGVEIGPMIDEKGLQGALEHIEDAVSKGAELKCGGDRLERDGYFLAPTVLTDVPEEAVCLTEETFAPVAPICRFETEEEAIKRANDTEFGLAAYAYTRDIGRAFRLGEGLEAGTIGINDAVPSTSICPFGGMKQSGIGRELGQEGLDAFLETKHVSIGGID